MNPKRRKRKLRYLHPQLPGSRHYGFPKVRRRNRLHTNYMRSEKADEELRDFMNPQGHVPSDGLITPGARAQERSTYQIDTEVSAKGKYLVITEIRHTEDETGSEVNRGKIRIACEHLERFVEILREAAF